MPVKSNVPIRICGSKTRTGCRTCKQRHVKCDERLPICMRCEKANRQCVFDQLIDKSLQPGGHSDRMKGIQLSNPSRHATFLHPSSPYDNISLFGPHELAEANAVKYFVAYQGKELAGCFSDHIWCHVLPQIAQHEPAVWHAMTAVSMLDRGMRFDFAAQAEIMSDPSTAIRQYGKAMQILNERMERDTAPYSKHVVLICCVLFAIFECLQNRFEPALRHISGGTKLLVEWASQARNQRGETADGYLDYTSLQSVFLSLDSQAVQMGVNAFQISPCPPSGNDLLEIPSTFQTVDEAHFRLSHIFNRISRWAESFGRNADANVRAAIGVDPVQDDWSAAESQRLRIKLMEWDIAFAYYQSTQQQQQQSATMLLLVQRKAIQAFFERQLGEPSEMEWDNHVSLFEEAVEYAEAYTILVRKEQSLPCTESRDLNPHREYYGAQAPHSLPRRPVFTIAMDMVLPLFLISAKCRDSKIRRRALTMLKSCDRKEGIWDSHLSAQVAEKIMKLEEQGALADGHIPESARIYELDVRLTEDAAGSVTHKKLVIDEYGSQSVEYVEDNLSW